ncbi:MAG: DUF192 domain-containing protein [Candidatus Obscuribacter phosphatis]|uniref:DUF192 domain-containing protein n=1 Tax=Candidatus Obscuribacter phosphatis TaxID=1906157 RepID=A0A8J7TN28_9BACT|nr:DUF192 domain-containing protein [Candidatus Obscuribacter phosphatis]
MLPKNSAVSRCINLSNERVIAERVRTARSFFSRLRGLLGTDQLPSGEGLLIAPCSSIHMFGMRYAIDVIFFDKDLAVIGLVAAIPPGKTSKIYSKALGCVELPSGTIAEVGIALGDRLQFQALS